jgi:hypothetical protein
MPVTTASGNVVGVAWVVVVVDGGVAGELDAVGAGDEDVAFDVSVGVGATLVQAARIPATTTSAALRSLPDEFTPPA